MTNQTTLFLDVGTNDLRIEKTASQIAKSIMDLTTSLKNYGNLVIVSDIVLINSTTRQPKLTSA